MTHGEAEGHAEYLSSEHPAKASYRWFAREVGGDWSVMRISLPHDHAVDALRPMVEARPRSEHPDDSRPSTWRDLGRPNIRPV